MKKVLALTLVLFTLLGVTAVTAAAALLGGGAEVIAQDMEMIKTGLVGQKITFSDTDFKTALGITDFRTVTVTALPSSLDGTLVLAGRRVGEGQSIKRKNIAALHFLPSSSTEETELRFRVEGAGAGTELRCVLKFIDKVNYAPTVDKEAAGNLSIQTQKGVSVYGRMAATDPEGDGLTYIIIRYPSCGTLKITDEKTGEYRYTPTAGYTGSDSFIFTVRDEYGNYTPATRVSVSVSRRQTDVVYEDMEDRPEYNAALIMTAMGVMGGEIAGDNVYFRPEETVTRAEFVAMAMKTHGIRADSTLTATFFDDNGDIPPAYVSYVATAQRMGVVTGSFDGKALNFRPNDPITRCEAAIVMANLLGKEATGESPAFADADAVPVWARPSVYACVSLGIYSPVSEKLEPDEKVTRADAAQYLYRLSQL